jgi:FAD/FMN-containing dehydrogenase
MTRTWDRRALDPLLERGLAIGPSTPGFDAYRDDVVMEGHPDAVARPRSEAEIVEILAHAHAHRVPITFAGGQTSLTGGSVAPDGLLVALEKMDRILDVGRDPETGGMVAVAEPGIFLGDFQRALEDRGWFYPPDPTSRDEAQLGATVATNATGEDTLLYGPTRRWVRELRVVAADGTARTLRRPHESRPTEEKATAGYYPADHEIDLMIGSEGTLAAITRVTVDLIERPPGFFAGLAFFPSLLSALRFVVEARRNAALQPRALELFDRAALEIARDNPEGIVWPDATGAAIAFKQEYRDLAERDARLDAWLLAIEASLAPDAASPMADAVIVMDDPPSRARLRAFRHRVPATLNEKVGTYRQQGGGKLGTDWWVPYPEIPEFLEGWRRRLEVERIQTVMFGHIGNGHPHVNFLPRDAGEKERAKSLLVEMCRGAVARGGGVAGEHGLGKLKRDLLAIQYPEARIAAMRDIKRRWDPNWILGRGNLFSPEDS